VSSDADRSALRFETISDEAAFSALAGTWDDFVRVMPRPSPLLLHGWLQEWWRHYGGSGELAVQAAFRDGKLVAALPLCVQRRRGLKVLTFLGGDQSPLADLLLAEREDQSTAVALAQRAAGSKHDFADFFGLPSDSRLAAALGPASLHMIMRAEAPVMDLTGGDWNTVYRAKTTSKKRGQHRRRRRQLAALGRLETTVARTAEELAPALEDAFVLHKRRWRGRPDQSGFTTSTGMRFQRRATAALAEVDVPRIVTLKLDGRPIAFAYYFALEERMICHRLAFDPEFERYSPGLVNRFDALEIATSEGAKRVEFLGGTERYKMELADRVEPLHEALGLAASVPGRAALAGRISSIRFRRFLKRSPRVRRLYYEGLAPTRRLVGRLGGRLGGHA
jgi:CelD/BcsL family acetyltransferase involved in cellulose biosynthesis